MNQAPAEVDVEEVREQVRAVMRRHPSADAKFLRAAVLGRRPDLRHLDPRSFNARFVLPEIRAQRKPPAPETPPAPAPSPVDTGAAAREKVRAELLALAGDVCDASLDEIVDLVIGLDERADRIVKFLAMPGQSRVRAAAGG